MKLSERIQGYRVNIHSLPNGGYFITDADLAQWKAKATKLEAENERVRGRYTYVLNIAQEVVLGMKDVSKQMKLRIDALKKD